MAQKPLNPEGGEARFVRFRVVPKMLDRIDELAALRGTNRSTVVREAVDRMLAEEEQRSA